ncbi:MAG: NAD-dependent epimerase/dehydratase family protein [Polyangiaceae bacterium]|nr:NAD-dependent epimerase/dehydratase family protein [Polyangiaceae bacterium]
MHLLVTGAAGFIGSHLAEALARAGHRVVGLDAFTDFYDRSLKEENARAVTAAGGEVVRLDLATDDLSLVVRGIDAVFHLAAQPGLSARTTFDDYVRNNLVATGRLLAAIESHAPAARFINISTSSVYGALATGDELTLPAPTSAYGVTKLAAEQLVLSRFREGALAACSLRIFSVYGARERPDKLFARLIRAVLTGTAIPLFEGSEQHYRSFSYIADIVSGITKALDQWDIARGEIFNIGTDVEITTGQALATVERLLGKKAFLERLPRRPGDQLRTHANINKARRLLHFAPKTSLEEGLAAEIAWTKSTGRY